MFLRCKVRRKDGKQHRYWSVVENTRVAGGRVVQRHVLYLGEINDTQELAWRRSIEVVEDGAAQPRKLSLFPEDRCEGLLGDASIVGVGLSELRLRRPRQWGACWLALMLWRELQLDQFWSKRLGVSRKGTQLGQVLFVLALTACWRPGSEWRLHREWFQRSAMADLLGEELGLAEIHKLYRCHDRLLNTSKPCSIIWWGGGATCSTSATMCCSMRSLTKSSAIYRFSTVCSHHLLLRARRVKFPWSGVDKALFGVAACRVCRLLPAPFDGMLDDRTIIGLA